MQAPAARSPEGRGSELPIRAVCPSATARTPPQERRSERAAGSTCAAARPRPRAAWLAGHVLILGLTLGFDCSPAARYSIEMRAGNDGLTRAVRRLDGTPRGTFDPARSQLLREIYGSASRDGVFKGSFSGALPADLGGSGAVLVTESPLGRTVQYRERFRGEDAPSKVARRFERGAEQLAEITRGWIPEMLGEGETATRVEQIVQEELIPDLRELAFYRWLRSSGFIGQGEQDVRAAQFVVERGYATLESEIAQGRGALSWRPFAQSLLAERGIEVTLANSKELGILLDLGRLSRSAQTFVARSEGFARWADTRQGANETLEKGLPALAAGDVTEQSSLLVALVGEYLVEVFPETVDLLPIDGLDLEARADLALRVPSEPLRTNGAWDPESRTLRWNVPIHRGSGLSAFAYAEWSEADFVFQVTHFGRVFLEGADLAEHNAWYARLPEARKVAWSEFLTGLTPDLPVADRIRSFRFPGETFERRSSAGPALDILLERLGASVFANPPDQAPSEP